MGRILVQNRRPVVPNVATLTIADAAIAAWNGFSESDTQSMLIGGWIKKSPITSYDAIYKGSYNVTGVIVTARGDQSGKTYTILNKSGTSTNTGYSILHDRLRWFHALFLISRTSIKLYKNGINIGGESLIAGFNNGECWQGAPGALSASGNNAGKVAGMVFASTNDPNKVLATDEQIRALYETGAIPPDVIYWPMDEGSGSGAGTCKAYVNGANVPALDGNLNANSWVADSPFN